ncbi:hypothetical protein D3C86_1656330 [compost metagenome]
MGVVFVVTVLCVGQDGVDVDDSGVFQLGGEEVLLLAVARGAEPFDLDGRQHFSGGQGLVEHG